MAIVHFKEEDFFVVANVAKDAQERGDEKAAVALDRLARMANAALTNEKYKALRAMSGSGKVVSWRDVPSTIST